MSQRRYRIGTHEIYDERYNYLKQRGSSILSPQNFDMSDTATRMRTESGLRSLLEMWEGDENGMTKNKQGRTVPSKLKEAKNALTEIDKKFEHLRWKALQEGKVPPEDMPADLQEKKIEAEAKLDIVKEEIAELKKRLKVFEDKQQKKSDSDMLKYGPKGRINLHGGIPKEIDGQRANVDKHGIPIIDDERSPYDGMTVMAYTALVAEPWEAERTAKDRERRREYKEKLEKGLSPKPPKRFKPNAAIKREHLPERPSDEAIEAFHDKIGLDDLKTTEEEVETADS